MLRTAVLLVVFLASAAPAVAAPLVGRVLDLSPYATYEIQVFTSLDLTGPDQPAARAPVDPVTGEFALEFDGGGRPFWVFAFERFQPQGGPPLDLYLPADLMPLYDSPADPIEIPGVDPVLLMRSDKFRFEAEVITKWVVLALLLFGGGFGVRRKLRGKAAPEGGRCAPLVDFASRPPALTRERLAILVIVAVAVGLRLRGMFSESLDLLELSYTPGIGRPVPQPSTPIQLFREISRLYCLDLTHPPGYHLITGLMGLLGRADWLLRVPGLVSSIATCVLVWRLFRRWSVAAGLGSAAVFACCAPGIYFGQDATPYAAIGLLSVVAVLLLMRALETGRSRAWSAWFGVMVFGFFLHYTMALLGVGLLLTVFVVAWRGRADRRWPAAIHRAMRPAILWSPLPVAWVWLHFSTHPSISEFTRLFSDAYLPGVGLVPWVWDFWSVTGGLQVDVTPWAAAAMTPLFGLGLWRAVKPKSPSEPPAELGFVLIAMAVIYLFSVRFFYVGQMQVLAGHVLYAFRWVGWFLPLVIGVCVLGALHGRGDKLARLTLATAWLVGVGLATTAQLTTTARPDFSGAAAFIRSELADGDGVATLPAWFQRGNLAWYLMGDTRVSRLPDEGEGVWMLDGKRVTVEAIHQGLPFETTVRNVHHERLWVAVVDEAMFGRDKFRESVGEQAIAWADVHMVPDGIWQFERIRLHRYRHRPQDAALTVGARLQLSASQTVLTHRTYPPLPAGSGFVPGAEVPRPGPLGPTVLHNAPMSPGCVDWIFAGLKPSLLPAAPNHWYLNALVPLAADRPLPELKPAGPAQIAMTRRPGLVKIVGVGGPCDGPPLEFRLE